MPRSEDVPADDLYQVLEVDPRASRETIDAAWRSLVKRHHPDVHPDAPDARMRMLNLAHEWLIDPGKRARYDEARPNRKPHQRPRHPGPTPAAATPRIVGTTVSPPRRLPWAIYLIGAIASSGLAYVASVVAVLVLRFANVTVILAAVVGTGGVESLLQLVGNVLFGIFLGYFVTACYASAFHADQEPSFMLVGALTTLGLTFGLPAFLASYLPSVVSWMADDGNGLPSVVMVAAIEGVTVALAVALAANLRRPA